MQTSRRLHTRLRKRFSRSQKNYQAALTEFFRSLTLIVDLKQLLENLTGKIREISDISPILILLRDPESMKFNVAGVQNTEIAIPIQDVFFHHEDRLVQWLTTNETPLIVPENPGVMQFLAVRERELLRSMRIHMIVPFIVMNRVTGMVLLGSKQDEEGFTAGEIDLLTTLLSQSALAFENAMLYQEQKQRLRKMFRADRLATIGQIAAGAAHEIRNPLTSIRSTIQYLRKKDTDPTRIEMLKELMSEVDRIDEIIQGLLSFSKPVAPQKEEVDLAKIISQVLTLTASTARRNKVQFTFNQPKTSALIDADPSQLKQVFLNIIFNAIQAMEGGGALSIQVERISENEPTSKAAVYRIQFQDTGPGIPEESLDQIFDPFFTTKKDGTGLGLSISYGIIQQHGGEIEIRSVHGKEPSGTTVTVILRGKGLQS